MRITKILLILSAFFLSTSVATAVITIDPKKYHEERQAEKAARGQTEKNTPLLNSIVNKPVVQKKQPEAESQANDKAVTEANAQANTADKVKSETDVKAQAGDEANSQVDAAPTAGADTTMPETVVNTTVSNTTTPKGHE